MVDEVLVSTFDSIATVVLNRPEKHNALNQHIVKLLIRTFKELSQDDAVRVVILKSHGKNFCAGGDIAWMQQMAESSFTENQKDAAELALLMQTIYTFPKPVILLAQGVTLGGGLGLLAVSDIVIAASDASFAFSEVKVGIAPSVISPYVMSAIGERAARYYFLTATRFHVNEAHHLGLVHQIVEAETLTSTGLTVAHQLLECSSTAMKEVKRLIHAIAREPITDKLIQVTAEHLAKMRTSPDGKEGLQAFLEKRTAKWS